MGRRVPVAFKSRLREVREQRGIPQAELARRAGLSRQALSAIEQGRYLPNTAVALRLARALGCAVEDLFGLREEAVVRARLAHPDVGTVRVRVGRVRGRLVAWPLRGFTFAVCADGVIAELQGARIRLFPASSPEEVLFVAGCDPALRIAAQLAERQHSLRVHWIPLSSLPALQAVRDGLVHVAGTHFHPPEDPEGVRTIRGILGKRRVVVVTVARWAEGLVVRPDLARRLNRPEDLLRPGVRIVNREGGSGTRLVFDRWLEGAGLDPRRIQGYGHELGSHLAVAEAVSAGLADAGPGVLPVARAYGLAFLPIAEQSYDLVIPEDLAEQEPVRIFLDLLMGRPFRQELVSLGYDPSPAGEIRTLR